MAPPPESDEELAVRAGRGDTAAGAALFARYSLRLVGFLRTTGDLRPDDAEDTAQRVWLRVWAKLPRWTADPKLANPFQSWILAIARNAATDVHRNPAWKRTQQLDDADRRAGREVGVGLAAEFGDDLRKFRECVGKLPGEFRSIIDAYLDQVPDETLAEKDRVKPVTIRTRRARALAWLRACMGVTDR